jgi:hypothetical protein
MYFIKTIADIVGAAASLIDTEEINLPEFSFISKNDLIQY